MIVVYDESGWQITTQRSHGMLAAQIAMHWHTPVTPPQRWLETLLAIAEHDDAEDELDGETLLTHIGAPLNFKMKAFDLAHCEKVVTHSLAKSQYILLLTSLHMEFLYRADASKDKTANKFLAAQKKLRTVLCKKLGISKKQSEQIYALLEFCDAFSLILCQHFIPPEHRKLEISTGPDGKTYQLFRLSRHELIVDPWPFTPGQFTVYFESRTIKKMQFAHSVQLKKAFMAADVEEIQYTIMKKPARYQKSKKV